MSIFDKIFGKKDEGRDAEEITARAFAEIDQHLRKASIAQVGGFRPGDDPKASWFGDVLVGREGEGWPEWNRKPMTPLIQINLREAPYVPERLSRFEFISVFVDAETLPSDTPHGEGWLVRSYEASDHLQRLGNPNTQRRIKPFPIRWELADNEGPCWEDALKLADLSAFNDLKKSGDLFYERYSNSERTKIGGWPSLIQCELQFDVQDFVFQIGTEEKAEWSWGDAGIGYFGLDEGGAWEFEWQCY